MEYTRLMNRADISTKQILSMLFTNIDIKSYNELCILKNAYEHLTKDYQKMFKKQYLLIINNLRSKC